MLQVELDGRFVVLEQEVSVADREVRLGLENRIADFLRDEQTLSGAEG